MPALREILARFGFTVDDKELKKAKIETDNYATRIKFLAEKVMGGAVGDAFKDWTSDVKEQAGEIRKLAGRLGVGVEEAQRWTNAANFAGVSSDAMNGAMLVLNKTIAAAADGSNEAASGLEAIGDGGLEAVLGGKKAQELFKSLGVDVKDAAGNMKSTTQVMGDVGLAIAAIKNPAERSATAMKVFGRQGATLIPLFAKGEKGLQEYLDRIDELGGGLSEKTILAMKDAGIATKEYDAAVLGLKSEIVGAVIPAMTKKAATLARLIGMFRHATKDTNIMRAAILVVGGALLFLQRQAIMAGIKTAMAWAPTIIAVGLLILLVDDLITAFDGGESVVGTFGKKLLAAAFGADTAADMIKSASKMIGTIGSDVGKASTIGGKIEAVFADVGFEIVKFFVDDIPEAFGYATDGLGTSITTWLSGINDSLTYGLLDLINGAVTWSKDAAKSLIDGLVNGIKGGAAYVLGAISDLGAGVVGKLRSVFDWHSPSGITEDLGLGGLDMGLVKGIAKGAPLIDRQVDKTFGGTLDLLGSSPQVRPSAGALASNGPSGPTVVDQRNTFHQTFPNSADPGSLRDTVRLGTQEGLGDLRSSLSALEAQA